MSIENNKSTENREVPVQEKLKMLYELQTVVSEIDKINTLRGELPLEVQDLEDEIVGLKTRITNYNDEITVSSMPFRKKLNFRASKLNWLKNASKNSPSMSKTKPSRLKPLPCC